MESERGMARLDRVHQDDIANMLCIMYRDQKPDLGRARRLIRTVYRETINQLASTGSIIWNKRYDTHDFTLERNTYCASGETLVGLIYIADKVLSKYFIRLMLKENQNLETLDWVNVIYQSQTDLNEQQIERLSQLLKKLSYTAGSCHERVFFMHQLYNRKKTIFSPQAIREMLAYFQHVLTEIERIPAEKVKFSMLCSMLNIFNDLAKDNRLIQEDQKHESQAKPERLISFVLNHIGRFKDAKELSGKIMALPDISHLLKSPQFDWGFKSSPSEDVVLRLLALLLKWCSSRSCEQAVLNKLCDYLSYVAYNTISNSNYEGLIEYVFQFNRAYFQVWFKKFIEVYIEKHAIDFESVFRCKFPSGDQEYFPTLIKVLNKLPEDKKRPVWEWLIENNYITANNIMLFYQVMTRKESCDFARLLIQYQKPLFFAEHTDSKQPHLFQLGSNTMPSAPLALTQEALSCTFNGGDAKREGEQLNMLGWLLYYDLLPFQTLRQCVVNGTSKCDAVHQSFVGKFPSFNIYLILKDTSSLPEAVVNICMLYLAHPDLYNTIETLFTHASIMYQNQVLVEELSDDPLPPPLPEHVRRDSKTPGHN